MRVALLALPLVILGLSGPARAEWARDASLLTVNLGYASAQSRLTDETLNGGTFGVSIDHVISNADWSFGILFNYISAEDVTTSLDNVTNRRIHSSPIFLTSRFWFGSPRVKAHGGLGFGWHTSSAEATIDGEYNKDTTNGIAIAVLFGVDWFLGEKMYLNANIQPTLMANALVANDAAILANLGVGWRI